MTRTYSCPSSDVCVSTTKNRWDFEHQQVVQVAFLSRFLVVSRNQRETPLQQGIKCGKLLKIIWWHTTPESTHLLAISIFFCFGKKTLNYRRGGHRSLSLRAKQTLLFISLKRAFIDGATCRFPFWRLQEVSESKINIGLHFPGWKKNHFFFLDQMFDSIKKYICIVLSLLK